MDILCNLNVLQSIKTLYSKNKIEQNYKVASKKGWLWPRFPATAEKGCV